MRRLKNLPQITSQRGKPSSRRVARWKKVGIISWCTPREVEASCSIVTAIKSNLKSLRIKSYINHLCNHSFNPLSLKLKITIALSLMKKIYRRLINVWLTTSKMHKMVSSLTKKGKGAVPKIMKPLCTMNRWEDRCHQELSNLPLQRGRRRVSLSWLINKLMAMKEAPVWIKTHRSFKWVRLQQPWQP